MGVYLNNAAMETNITAVLLDNGSQVLSPSTLKNRVPTGTLLVTGTWSASYYAPDGSFICTAGVPGGCMSSDFAAAENGGHVVVNFLVTNATPGESLTLSYTFNWGSSTVTISNTFTVSS